jgi:hypothetical protein
MKLGTHRLAGIFGCICAAAFLMVPFLAHGVVKPDLMPAQTVPVEAPTAGKTAAAPPSETKPNRVPLERIPKGQVRAMDDGC